MNNAIKVASYIGGQWHLGEGESSQSLDPASGDVVASLPRAGIDVVGAFQHARAVGCKTLATTTFHQRAGMLKDIAKSLSARKDELYEISLSTGASRADGLVDIDGGLGTLFVYGSRGTNELPNAKVLTDGKVENLSKDGSFVAQHIYAPRQGVALQINAFNFPVWGLLEKFAPAFLAGVPVVIKPAGQTAFLSAALVRMMTEAIQLPEGAVQLISDPAHVALEHIGSQDVIAFTGSQQTAKTIASHPRVLEHNPRMSFETDSLNATVLGPEASIDDEEAALFITEIKKELISKSGQKCTAIRRIFVQEAIADQVEKALIDNFSGVVIGNPRHQDVHMGPLVSLKQKVSVDEAISTLAQECAVVLDGRHVKDPVDAEQSDSFLRPTLLRTTTARADAVNRIEAFGPVATIISYSDIEDLVATIKAGEGSLAGSVFSRDSFFITDLVAQISSYHGRLLVVNAENAKTHTGHGSPLPMLLHGGPGRAGGGEELGGIRAVKHYMQRTAIQATPDVLAAITGQWVKGTPTIEKDVHPFRMAFHDLEIGRTFYSGEREVTLDDIEAFAHLTGDTFYAHMDEAAAQRNPLFGGRVAHGYLLVSIAAGLFVDPPYGPVLANYGIDNLRFTKPVKPGTWIKVRLTCKHKSFRQGKGYGEVAWDTEITDREGNVCASYDVLTMVSDSAVPDAQ